MVGELLLHIVVAIGHMQGKGAGTVFLIHKIGSLLHEHLAGVELFPVVIPDDVGRFGGGFIARHFAEVEEALIALGVGGSFGGGKSTLAKIIAGIYTPTSGRILLDGEDITALSITERARRGISYAFQQPVRFKGLRVGDLMNLAAGKDANIAEVCAYLSEVGLCARDYIDRELDASLSGGELKRIEIAMVLARGTALSVFDEPEAGIDLWSFQNLIRVFEKMYEQTRGSILIISHQERILNIADTIVLLKDGRLAECGPREEVLPRLLRNIDTAPPVCSMLSDPIKEVR